MATDSDGAEGGCSMTWQIIVAMFVTIPILLLPVALVWYLNAKDIKDLLLHKVVNPSYDSPAESA